MIEIDSELVPKEVIVESIQEQYEQELKKAEMEEYKKVQSTVDMKLSLCQHMLLKD